MALSLDAIYQPLNDFFVNHFTTGPGSQVIFRFERFGSVVSESDFSDPIHPENSANVAMETFSGLVNRIPIEQPDNLSIAPSQVGIDETYDTLLEPALPVIPEGTDEQTAEALVSSFSSLKLDAQRRWQNVKMESSTGLMFEFKPSLASPKDWYNKANQDNWTHQSFQISAAASPGSSAPDSTATALKLQLWRQKIDAPTLQKLVATDASAQPNSPSMLATKLVAINPARPMLADLAVTSAAVPVRMASPAISPQFVMRRDLGFAARANLTNNAAVAGTAEPSTTIDPAPSNISHEEFFNQVSALPLENRIVIQQYLGNNAPTKPATTNSLTIAFDYCLVNISRPWYRESFLQNKSWFLPNTLKGARTAHAPDATNLTLMPVALVAIKALNIQANWSADDVANSQDSTQFGPFKIESGIINNSLSHQGIQIVGWLLERMPDLPPNDAPGSHGPATTEDGR
jgi:hypothetical protein